MRHFLFGLTLKLNSIHHDASINLTSRKDSCQKPISYLHREDVFALLQEQSRTNIQSHQRQELPCRFKHIWAIKGAMRIIELYRQCDFVLFHSSAQQPREHHQSQPHRIREMQDITHHDRRVSSVSISHVESTIRQDMCAFSSPWCNNLQTFIALFISSITWLAYHKTLWVLPSWQNTWTIFM